MSQAKRLLAAFAGASNAHGTTTVGRVGRNGKAESNSKIIRETLTEALVQDHIDGGQGIGAIPINESNQCKRVGCGHLRSESRGRSIQDTEVKAATGSLPIQVGWGPSVFVSERVGVRSTGPRLSNRDVYSHGI